MPIYTCTHTNIHENKPKQHTYIEGSLGDSTSLAEMETGLWLRHLVMACHPDMDNALIQLIVEQGMSIIPDDRLFVTLVVKCLMVHAGKQIPSAMCCLRLVLNLLKISLCFLENFLKAKHSLRYQNPCLSSLLVSLRFLLAKLAKSSHILPIRTSCDM